MIAATDGGAGVIVLVIVLVLLAGRIGFALGRSRERQSVAQQVRQVPDIEAGQQVPLGEGAGAIRPTPAEQRPPVAGAPPFAASPTNGRAALPGRAALDVSRAAADAILEITDLTVAYGTKTAVDRLSLQIGRGEIFGLLGPNGAGKTSTLSAVEGLVKPRSGTVLLDGRDIARDPIRAKAQMGVQLQATSFQAELSVKQIVRLYAGLYGLRMSDAEITSNLDAIGLGGEAAKPFKQLSGGQQQRLSLDVAVIHEPALLLLDEPTAGLDPQSRRQL
ncbi:MAG TPA: ABC transporter ATP-binding protein, partial [Acidimicrobiales bacterium]|nr:ABC transporter ATP-binding protein [Acidimicrobiales bacterium]